jgi:hypothetical protein
MRTIDRHRIPAIDIARGYAVLTMFVAHVQPSDHGGLGQLLTIAAGGERPRTLFAVTGGIALGLFVASGLRRGENVSELRRIVAVRGVFLVALGLFLQTMSSGVSVVLDTWGLLFLIALPFLLVRSAALLIGGATVLVVGTAVDVWVGDAVSPGLRMHTELFQLIDWLTTGSYPLLIWLGFLAIGYAVSRVDLERRRNQAVLLVVGAVLFSGVVVAVLSDPDDAPAFLPELLAHLSAVGFALGLLGALLLVTSGTGVLPRVIGVVLFPLRAVGSMPLTIYTAHVVGLATWRSFGAPGVEGWVPFATLTVLSLVFATLWRLFVGQGPLERLIAIVSRSPRGTGVGIQSYRKY